ncbi:esterase B1-like [Uranotaenia lowii]|uniref:esterase B1-like n=1 Tax=Uranotaenia lowii TaxID=190385 RepID=UPI00247AF6CF|nr:esterase B1-like [Uranotaenia lowii]
MVIRKLYVPPAIVGNGNGHPPAAVVAAVPEVKTADPEEITAYAVVEEQQIEERKTEAQEIEEQEIVEQEIVEQETVEQELAEQSTFAAAPTTEQEEQSRETSDDVIVQIKAGKIAGAKEQLPNGGDLYRFSGIPYAKAPVGELRFKPPVALEKLDDELTDCRNERNNCLSISYYPPEEAATASEDCLFLNVYTPKLSEDQAAAGLPVMVFVHGGGFGAGSGNAAFYYPNLLVQEGVVVVTMNYRLGPLGFLYMPEIGIYGNMGMKDQRLALAWVQDNIANFGGDPGNVTLFGESAGGAAVHLHYISRESRKYFHKAICMSGVSYNPWVLQTDGAEKARGLAALLGADSTKNEEVYNTLMNASAKDLVANSPKLLTEDEQRTDMFYAFTPVVEPADSVEPFLVDNFISATMDSSLNGLPLMSGITSNEGLLLATSALARIHEYRSDPTKFVPRELTLTPEQLAEVGDEIRNHFFVDGQINEEQISAVTDIISDNMFVTAAYVAGELHARYQPETPHYFYVFAFEDELNKFKNVFQVPADSKGACHGDDLTYIFNSAALKTEVPPDSRANRFRETMCKLWTNFAKYSNPTPPEGGIDFVWEPVKPVSDSKFILNGAQLDEELKMIENPFLDRVQFWRELYEKYYGGYLVPKA